MVGVTWPLLTLYWACQLGAGLRIIMSHISVLLKGMLVGTTLLSACIFNLKQGMKAKSLLIACTCCIKNLILTSNGLRMPCCRYRHVWLAASTSKTATWACSQSTRLGPFGSRPHALPCLCYPIALWQPHPTNA